jgi:hypothetical protein
MGILDLNTGVQEISKPALIMKLKQDNVMEHSKGVDSYDKALHINLVASLLPPQGPAHLGPKRSRIACTGLAMGGTTLSSGTDQHRACRIKIVRCLCMSNTDLWKKELWTQSEVAAYFRVVSGTVKNWRGQGLLSYWQAPGSSKVLYYRDEIRNFRDKNTVSKKGGDKPTTEFKKVKPSVSPVKKDWRI